MVGDTINDALMAKNCEIKFIGVEWGFNNKSLLIQNGAKDIARKKGKSEFMGFGNYY